MLQALALLSINFAALARSGKRTTWLAIGIFLMSVVQLLICIIGGMLTGSSEDFTTRPWPALRRTAPRRSERRQVGASQLLGLDLILAVLTAAAWCAAAWFVLDTSKRPRPASHPSARLARPLVAALLLTDAKSRGSSGACRSRLAVRERPRRRRASRACRPRGGGRNRGFWVPPAPGGAEVPGACPCPLWAATGATASMLVPFILGYEPDPGAVAVFLALAAGGALVCRLVFGPHADPRRRTAAAAVGAVWTRTAVMVLDRQLRFADGVPRYAYTVSGAAYPQLEPLVVGPGDVLKGTVVNRSSEPRPMSRSSAATGSRRRALSCAWTRSMCSPARSGRC